MTSHRPVLVVLLGLVPACQPHTSAPAAPPKSTTRPCAPETASPFHVERMTKVGDSFFAGYMSSASALPTADARRTCEALDPALAPFCYEGLSFAYAHQIAEAFRHDDAARASELARGFGTAMDAIDARWSSIHCRGLAKIVGLGRQKVDPLLPLVDPRCLGFFAELMGRNVLDGVPCTKPGTAEAADATPACQQDIVAHLEPDPCTEATRFDPAHGAARCAFGIGRGIGNAFPGRLEFAAATCRGPVRAGCLAGVAYVATYLYPDRMERALESIARLPATDRASYIEGVANALAWRERSDPEQLKAWIARLPPELAQLANAIRDSARQCKLYDYGEGTGCRWPEVTSCAP